MIDEELLNILACPVCKSSVRYDDKLGKIICMNCGRRYPVKDDIPIMLVQEAEMPESSGGGSE